MSLIGYYSMDSCAASGEPLVVNLFNIFWQRDAVPPKCSPYDWPDCVRRKIADHQLISNSELPIHKHIQRYF